MDRHVYPTQQALSDLAHFDEALPTEPAETTSILEMLHRFGSPATVTQTGGRYYGFVNGGILPATLAAKWLSDCWDQNTAMQVLSPVSSKLEQVVQGWLRDLLGLPPETVAGFVSGTSSATFCGLAAARFRLLNNLGWNINDQGLFGAPRLRVVAGRQAHSTVLKAIALLGFGRDHIEWVNVDDQGRMIPECLPELDSRTLLILQAGNVNSGAFDPFEPLCQKAQSAGAWVHVDGAFGLWAAADPRFATLTQGMNLATSWSVDGHKTLNTPYDCGIVLTRDEEALVSALHMSGAYIVLGDQRDGMFYTPEMSRRARIIELWAALKSLGRSGVQELIWTLHQRAKQFGDRLREHGFAIVNDVVFNQVMVRCESDAQSLATLKGIQEQRVCWCGGSKWEGHDVIRISVCSWATTPEDVERSVASFVKARDAILS